MGKFHHSKKHHGDKKKSSSSRLKYDLTQAGRRKLPEDFLYTQNHKSIWNSFSNFLDEKFAEEDLSEILDEDKVTRIKTAPAIPPMLQRQSTSVKQRNSGWIGAKCCGESNTQLLDPTRNFYRGT